MSNPCTVASAAVWHVEGAQGEALLQINQWNELAGPLKHKLVSLVINHRDVTLPAVSPPRCKAAWWTHGTWSPYCGNLCRQIPSPSAREWHPGRPEIWGGRRERRRGRIRGRGNKIYREDEKKREEVEWSKEQETTEVNGREDDRGEANRAASGAEHQSARSIHAHPSQRGRQGHFCCPLHHNVRNTANIRTLWVAFCRDSFSNQ